MQLIKTEIEGVFLVEKFHSSDERGSFTKTYYKEFFKKNGLCTDYRESYYSISKRNVIRGMHFQLPPHDHEKLVYVVKGEVTDVILDLRKESKTYGKTISIVLNDNHKRAIYIPKGLAHGFKSMVDDTIMIYNVSTVYHNESDFGVRFDSIDFDWDLNDPTISDRDKSLVTFEEFKTRNPF
jgi:dTDP-4-dehydrorhamnose 3,5-epimerase